MSVNFNVSFHVGGAEIAARDAELYAKTLHIVKLKAQLAALRRARFGRSSEKLEREIEQLELLIGTLEADEAEAAAPRETISARPESTKGRSGRRPLPDHLPREEVMHEAPCACPQCGGTRFGRIGQDEREILEYVPSHFKV
ncbi:IS66 family transposase zinc-finger binding domain-containing protein, partial [Microvirga brassicacearum]|uniref:IS66 family transposase n=1 Tax=Microvirga brassicacearum TaxID=2580413 RepID=UPI003B847485